MDVSPPTPAGVPGSNPEPRPVRHPEDASLRQAVTDFEAVFLAQMLDAMGVGREPTTFGGGFGAEAFRSFLHEAYAKELVGAGGVGIAEDLYRQLSGDPGHG
jgi:Rod binding domain-containing protein